MHIKLIQGDLTKLAVDSVVNAANSSLLGGGGVDGAIHRAGGPAILAACRAIRARQGGCPVGEAVLTTGGNLPATYVIHTVGPRWNGGRFGEAERLRACYLNSLALAETQQLRSIAFPNISTGIYGYPKPEAAKIALEAIRSFEAQTLEVVYVVCFEEENKRLYETLLQQG